MSKPLILELGERMTALCDEKSAMIEKLEEQLAEAKEREREAFEAGRATCFLDTGNGAHYYQFKTFDAYLRTREEKDKESDGNSKI